jgi:mannose-6-phosphate isomerase-like protein (cupin superfamily)
MWRKLGDDEETVIVEPGVSLTILMGTHFQFRSFGYEPRAQVNGCSLHRLTGVDIVLVAVVGHKAISSPEAE